MHSAPEVIYTCCLAMMVPWMRSESSLLGMFGQGIMQFSGKTYLRLTGTWQSWTHRRWLLSFQSGLFSKPKTCQKNSDNWITMFDIIVEFFLLLLILCVFWDWLALSDFCNSWMSWVSQRTHYFHPKIFSIFSVWTALIFLFYKSAFTCWFSSPLLTSLVPQFLFLYLVFSGMLLVSR